MMDSSFSSSSEIRAINGSGTKNEEYIVSEFWVWKGNDNGKLEGVSI